MKQFVIRINYRGHKYPFLISSKHYTVARQRAFKYLSILINQTVEYCRSHATGYEIEEV